MSRVCYDTVMIQKIVHLILVFEPLSHFPENCLVSHFSLSAFEMGDSVKKYFTDLNVYMDDTWPRNKQ